jgi:hypothetical protein
MGHTIKPLVSVEIEKKSVFNNRFCIEICEKVHTHYRNLRIVQSLDDFITMASGFSDALERWKKRGCPGTGNGIHIELCRKQIAICDDSNLIQVNLNDNLYNKNKDGIFALGADFTDEKYIHMKLRDLRLEMSINEFKEFADAVSKASRELENLDSTLVLQES